jgi:hypothetical protein
MIPFTFRESRHLHAPHLGAQPIPNLGQPAYPGNHFSAFSNKMLLTSLLPEERFEEVFGYDRDTFYEIRDAVITPLVNALGHRDHILTRDSILALFLVKLKHVSIRWAQ